MNQNLPEAKAMGQIIQFPGRPMSALERTQSLLRQAQASGHLAAAEFATCRDAMDWARSFHDRCNDAIEGASLDEMIRTRDALARDWADRCEASIAR